MIALVALMIGCGIGFLYGASVTYKTIDKDVKYFGRFRTVKAVYTATKTQDVEPIIKSGS